MNKKNFTIASIIDIGSNSLTMCTGQCSNGKIQILQQLEYPLSLGKDTFSTGKISIEKVNKACEILNKFVKSSSEYKVTKIKTVATTAVREAVNRDYVVEQIKLRTGLDIEVLDDSQEKTIIYKEIMRRLKGYKTYKNPALMIYSGVGNLGISFIDNNTIPFTTNIKMGSLRISEMFTSIHDFEEQYKIVIEDYLRGFNETFRTVLPKGEFKHFVASGRQVPLIAQLCNSQKLTENIDYIKVEDFNKLYSEISEKSFDQIMEDYDVSEENAELLKYSMSINSMLLGYTKATKIILPSVFIGDALLFEALKPKEAQAFNEYFTENTVISAKTMAKRYNFDEDHAGFVEKYSLSIFDKMKPYHGLGKKDRLLLRVAAITHDVGKYINIRNHYDHSYEIIRSSEIVGLSVHDMEIIANAAKYHSTSVPNMLDYNFNRLSYEDRMRVSKLTAILRIAEALDKGHIKKFENIDVKIKNNTLSIGIATLRNTQIEEWSFASKSKYFEEVFGMNAVIKKKRVM